MSEMGDLDDALARQHERLAWLGAEANRDGRKALVAIGIAWAATIAGLALPPYGLDGWLALILLPLDAVFTALFIATWRKRRRDDAAWSARQARP